MSRNYLVPGRKYIEINPDASGPDLFTFINRVILWQLLLNKTKNLIENNSFCKIHLFTTRHYLIFTSLVVLFASCAKTPTACFDLEDDYYLPVIIELNSCTEDVGHTVWDYGNGSGWEGETVNLPKFAEGKYTITLTVYAEDGRSKDEISKEIFVGYKYLDSAVVVLPQSVEAGSSVSLGGNVSNNPIVYTDRILYTFSGNAQLDSEYAGIGYSTGINEAVAIVYKQKNFVNPMLITLEGTEFKFYWSFQK